MRSRPAPGGMGRVSGEDIPYRFADGNERPTSLRARGDRTAAPARSAPAPARAAAHCAPAPARAAAHSAQAPAPGRPPAPAPGRRPNSAPALALAIGLAHMVSAAPHLADAVGDDIDAALERRVGDA
jgi:hypothetical protein